MNPQAGMTFGKTIATAQSDVPTIAHGSITHPGWGNDLVLSGNGGSGGKVFKTANTHRLAMNGSGHLYPFSDGALSIGKSGNRINTIYAANGAIQTSDKREKQNIQELSKSELKVAQKIGALIAKYKWRKSVEQKGAQARIHFGVVAQDLVQAFASEGLDAQNYSLLCYYEWWESESGDIYQSEAEAPKGASCRSRYGVRYDELFAL